MKRSGWVDDSRLAVVAAVEAAKAEGRLPAGLDSATIADISACYFAGSAKAPPAPAPRDVAAEIAAIEAAALALIERLDRMGSATRAALAEAGGQWDTRRAGEGVDAASCRLVVHRLAELCAVSSNALESGRAGRPRSRQDFGILLLARALLAAGVAPDNRPTGPLATLFAIAATSAGRTFARPDNVVRGALARLREVGEIP